MAAPSMVRIAEYSARAWAHWCSMREGLTTGMMLPHDEVIEEYLSRMEKRTRTSSRPEFMPWP